MLIILKDIENRVGGHCHLITFPNKRSERNFSRPIAYDLVSIRQCVETIQEEPKLKWVIDGNESSFLVTA